MAAALPWGHDIHRSWEALDDPVALQQYDLQIARRRARALRHRLHDGEAVERNGIRFAALVIDVSEAAAAPAAVSPLELFQRACMDFFVHFFENNPLSALSLHTTAHGSARVVSFPTASTPTLRAASNELFNQASRAAGAGQVSLASALSSACDVLSSAPPFVSREVVVMVASLRTIDGTPSLADAIDRCVAERVRVHIAGLHASVFAFENVCKATGGVYTVLSPDITTYSNAVLAMAAPPPALANLTTPALAPVAMPTRTRDVGVCVCHRVLTQSGFVCPTCRLRVCAVPTMCIGCNTFLTPATLLARASQRLRPLPRFVEVVCVAESGAVAAAPVGGDVTMRPAEVKVEGGSGAAGVGGSTDADGASARAQGEGESLSIKRSAACYGCGEKLLEDSTAQTLASSCGGCGSVFCVTCDTLVHSLLHACPGCTASAGIERTFATSR